MLMSKSPANNTINGTQTPRPGFHVDFISTFVGLLCCLSSDFTHFESSDGSDDSGLPTEICGESIYLQDRPITKLLPVQKR